MAKINLLNRYAAKVEAAQQNTQQYQFERGVEPTNAFFARISAEKAARAAAAKARRLEAAKMKRRAAIGAALNSLAGGEYKDFSCNIEEVLAAAGRDLQDEMKKAAKAARAKAMKAAKARRKEAAEKAKAAAKAVAAAKAAVVSAKADNKKGWVKFDSERAREIAVDIIKSDIEALKALERAIKWAIKQAQQTANALCILAADARKAGDRGLAAAILGEREAQIEDAKAKEKALAMVRIKIAELKAVVVA